MKLWRKVLIIGTTTLFAAVGCSKDDDSKDGADADPNGSAFRDATIRVSDVGGKSDQGSVMPDMQTGGSDMTMTPTDSEVEPTDMAGAVSDMLATGPDMSAVVPDMAMGGRCVERLGRPCEVRDEGCCDESAPIIACRPVGPLRHLTWVDAEADARRDCECIEEPNGSIRVSCP